MEPQSSSEASQSAARASKQQAGLIRFVARHPVGVIKGIVLLLLVVIVLQNLEPTSLDVLFWSVRSLPKLVLMLGAMLVGGVVWEILRRWLFR